MAKLGCVIKYYLVHCTLTASKVIYHPATKYQDKMLVLETWYNVMSSSMKLWCRLIGSGSTSHLVVVGLLSMCSYGFFSISSRFPSNYFYFCTYLVVVKTVYVNHSNRYKYHTSLCFAMNCKIIYV